MPENNNDRELDSEVMSPLQVVRIESVHRGFLYQHLYAVGCLLKLVSQSTGFIVVERDEDVELLIDNEIIFIQVKTRAGPLVPSDIKSALLRFDELRLHYAKAHSDKSVKFAVIANVETGPKLSKDIADDKWPSDVHIISPDSEVALHKVAPPAWRSINEAIIWCMEIAKSLPFPTLSPETLVWKLAARVQYASSGEDTQRQDHKFSRSDLPNLFEQLVEQLQSFPDIPSDYRVLSDEPSLITSDRVRLIIGFSGAGKTSWAACHARHSSASTVYFDVGDLPSGALATSLSRELAARFVYGSGRGAAQLPASTGLEVLQALNNQLNLMKSPVVVIDNVQRIDPEDLRRIVMTCSNICFVLLAQPWENQGRLEALLEVNAEHLRGWDSHTVAAVFSDEGAHISPQIAKLCTSLTGGLPLYVKSAASLCAKQYGGDAEAFINEVDSGEHKVDLAQEAILRHIVASLSEEEAQIIAALSLVTLHLSSAEINTYFAALPVTLDGQGALLRSLQRKGFLQFYANGGLKLHDALRLSANELLGDFSGDQVLALQVCLRDILFIALLEKRELTRLGAWLRLLGPTGKVEILVDFATTESFHELGDPSDLKAVLISTCADESITPSLRFWALDALAYWELQDDAYTRNPLPYIERMEDLLSAENFGDKEQLALIMKQMNLAGIDKDSKRLNAVFQRARPLFVNDAVLSRIARYNYAMSLYSCEKYLDSHLLAEALYTEYYDLLDLSPAQVIGANRQELMRLFENKYDEHQDNIKRLADSLNLAALCMRKMGRHPQMAAIHAAKFYQLSGSHRSEMRAAQDVADDFIDCGDALAARQTMEQHVLPVLRNFGFEASTMDVYGQYAVILAYCGKYASGRSEMAKLQAYVAELPSKYQDGFANQCNMIDQIEAGLIKLPSREVNMLPLCVPQSSQRKVKIGRNVPCPCGSGKKYKKCCLI